MHAFLRLRRQGPAVPQKLIIDADPGIGDAFAVLTALTDPSIEVVGLTATAGAVSGVQASRNLQFLVDLVDPLKHPRIGASNGASVIFGTGRDTVRTRHSFTGTDGLGDIEVTIPDLHNRRESAKLLVDLVRESPHEIRIVTLGPLTNLAAAFELDPGFAGLLDGVVCLGGTDQCAGDVSPVAEFNIGCDPEAASIVFQSPMSTVLVPLNVSSSSALTFEDVDVLTDLIQSAPNGTVLSDMLRFSYRAHHQLALEEIPLHAVVALAVAARAESFAVEPVRADVETDGRLTRGMTVIDRRVDIMGQTNIDVVSRVDEHGIVDYFSRSLRRIAG